MTKQSLAESIFKRIYVDGPFTFDELEARAIEKGLDIDLFYEAMEIVGRHRKLQVSGKTYKKRVNRQQEFQSHLTWINENYPRPEKCEHGIEYTGCKHCMPFPEIDFSYLFLTPSQMKEYKLSLKGGYAGRKNSKRNSQIFSGS